MMHRSPKQSVGIALITVLLVVAATAIAAVSISARLQVDIRRTENLIRTDQAWQHMLGIESWAKGELIEMARASPSNADPLGEGWAIRMKDDVEGGMVEGSIIDQQGLFNLNNLVDKDNKSVPGEKKYFEKLLEILDLDKRLANAVTDWLDKDSVMIGVGGAEDDRYQSLEPPYQAANRFMTHRSELLLIDGITPQIYNMLAPFVTTLPATGVTVNINTAHENVLLSIGLASDMVEEVLAAREGGAHFKKDDINTHPALSGLRDRSSLGAESNYFAVRSNVNIGKARVRVISLLVLERKPRPDKSTVTVLLRMREDIF